MRTTQSNWKHPKRRKTLYSRKCSTEVKVTAQGVLLLFYSWSFIAGFRGISEHKGSGRETGFEVNVGLMLSAQGCCSRLGQWDDVRKRKEINVVVGQIKVIRIRSAALWALQSVMFRLIKRSEMGVWQVQFLIYNRLQQAYKRNGWYYMSNTQNKDCSTETMRTKKTT